MHAFDALNKMIAVVAFGLAIITSLFAYPEIPVSLILVGYYFSFYVMGASIGEAFGWYHNALKFYAMVLIITVLTFGIIYWRYGLVSNGENIEISFINAIYFSVTTWTTLGYGDFAPVSRIRHITSVQAILGYVGLGLLIALMSGYMNNLATNRKEVREHNLGIMKEKSTDDNENS